MITLINGRGQLGQKMRELLVDDAGEGVIYHTWNVSDKSEKAQKREYDKFINFVGDNKSEKIIFVSTSSQKETYYTHYKHLSEAYLLAHCNRGLVIRLPMIVGKGVLPGIKNGKLKPHGEMELITLGRSAREVVKLVDYEGIIKSFMVRGVEIESDVVKQIMLVEGSME